MFKSVLCSFLFAQELARQKSEYEKKKCQAHQLKIHLLQQLGETESQVRRRVVHLD